MNCRNVLLTAALCLGMSTAAVAGAEPPRKLSASGTVVDSAGKPIAGARVYLREWPTSLDGSRKLGTTGKEVLATTTTDQRGAFKFEEVPTDVGVAGDVGYAFFPWDIVVQAKGYGLGYKPLTPHNQAQGLVITLALETSVRGRLIDSEGKPIAGARVQARAFQPLRGGGMVGVPPAGYWDATADIIHLHGSRLQPTTYRC
jgi:hypothetical protein